MKNLRYLLSFMPGILAIIGNLLGGYFSLMGIVYSMFILVILDRLFKPNTESPSGKEGDWTADGILFFSFVIHSLAIVTLLYAVNNKTLNGYFIWTAVFSTALNSGISGIISAHEMIHRKQAAWRMLGIWNLLLVNYGHFYIEHIKGHHKWVGTEKDPATAKRGESIYAFLIRTIPGQFKSALNIEATRLQKLNKFVFSLGNFVVRIVLLQLLVCIALYLWLGGLVLLAYLVQSWIAVFLLEYVNYIEHYGLTRNDNEKYNATHAWQSDIAISRFSLIELSRHSDHHLRASKPYQTLASLPESPVLPSGYFGVFYLVMIPPLWYKHVHPLLK